MDFSILTLGCKSNQYESQAMAKLLTQQGHHEHPHDTTTPLHAYIINTCSVTAVSDKKSRQTIRKIRNQHPNALVAVCGCYAQISPEEILALEVDLIGGTGDHLSFIQELESLHLHKGEAESLHSPILLRLDNPRQRLGIEDLPSGGLEGRTRALLKIQDGCENYCTYCIIPYTRGKLRSLPWADAEKNIQSLLDQGYLEIILTGIEISSWGHDFSPKEELAHFLQRADQLLTKHHQKTGNLCTLRLGSLEPRTITQEFCQITKDLPSLQPHFHLSLQSGSQTVLKRMNRKYTKERFQESLTLLRTHFQTPAITTDLITGFPGETEDEFQETMAFLTDCQLSSVHVFPYSKRPGTPADKMPNQLPNHIKSARAKTLTQLTQEHKKEYQKQFVGHTLPVLFESQQNQFWTGHSPHYIPVTLIEARETPLQNQRCEVTITGETEQGLQGTLAKK